MLNYPRIVWSQHNVLQHHQLYNMEVEIIPRCGQLNDLFLWSKFQQLLFHSCGQLQQPTLYFAHWPYCTHIGVCTCICAKIGAKLEIHCYSNLFRQISLEESSIITSLCLFMKCCLSWQLKHFCKIIRKIRWKFYVKSIVI